MKLAKRPEHEILQSASCHELLCATCVTQRNPLKHGSSAQSLSRGPSQPRSEQPRGERMFWLDLNPCPKDNYAHVGIRGIECPYLVISGLRQQSNPLHMQDVATPRVNQVFGAFPLTLPDHSWTPRQKLCIWIPRHSAHMQDVARFST